VVLSARLAAQYHLGVRRPALAVPSLAVLGVALATALVAAAPALGDSTSIAAVVAAPESYAGQEVTVSGTVAEPSVVHRGEVLYTLLDEGRRIDVVGLAPLPALGERLQVTATVGFKAPDEEFTWPPVLVESARQPAP
jgi:cytochrome c-type biogenesis protein CcmE